MTLGAGKFGTGTGSSEIDISDAFISMGIVGGICFLLMMLYTAHYLLEYLSYGPKPITYILVGLFASMFGSWIGAGQYALAPFMCFMIGFLARKHLERAEIEGVRLPLE